MERKEYEMTQEDFDKILEASQPVPYLVVGGHEPVSQRDRAMAAWSELGSRMGFDYMSVKPTGKGDLFFSAVPNEEIE